MNVIDLHPIPPCVNFSREAWFATPESVRSEIVRAWQEMSAGIAVQKDRCCGRPKSNKRPGGDSFFALHQLDMAAWARPDREDVAKAAAEMRARLAPDVAHLQMLDDLEVYHKMAADRGKTLAEVLTEFMAVEQRLKKDALREMERIALAHGVDFADVLAAALEPDEAA
jgi:hypothetical protein